MIARFVFSNLKLYFYTGFIVFVFTVSAFFVSFTNYAYADTIIWNDPSTRHSGTPLFWKFFDGSVIYYNLLYENPSEVDVSGADLIIAYTNPNDSTVGQVDKKDVPIVYFGKHFWFSPNFTRAWRFALFFSSPNSIYKNIRFYGKYANYISWGLLNPARNIVILHKTTKCSEISQWKRWWYPCAPQKPFKYFFELYGWPGKSGATARDIQIKYSAKIYNDNTGEIIKNGEVVPVGTTIRLSFGEYSGSQISWIGIKKWRYLLTYLRIKFGWSYWGWWIWNEKEFWKLYPKNNYGVWVNKGELPNASCREEDLVFASGIHRFGRLLLDNILNYITMAVEKPSQNIYGIENMQCQLSGNDTVCTITQEGDLNFEFVFGQTKLKAYHSYRRLSYDWWNWHGLDECLGVNGVMYKKTYPYSVYSNCNDTGRCWSDSKRDYKKFRLSYVEEKYGYENLYFFEPFEVTVPEQKIKYKISAVNSNSAPATPSISGDEDILVEQEATYTVSTSDAENDSVRAGADWDGDGLVDSWYPNDGYVQTSSLIEIKKVWNEIGEKTFAILSEDSKGARSPWAEFSTNVLGEVTLKFEASEYLIPKNSQSVLKWGAPHADNCIASGDWDGSKVPEGSERTATLTKFQNEYTLVCSNTLSSAEQTLSVYTYACGDGVCTTGVESCSSCQTDCGPCGDDQKSEWDVFLNLTEDPPQVRYGGGDDEVGN